MKRRVKNKLNSLKPQPSKVERMFNAARGFGEVGINHNGQKLVMLTDAKYEEMVQNLARLRAELESIYNSIGNESSDGYQEKLTPSRKRSEGDVLPR